MVQRMEAMGTSSGKPKARVVIADCGQVGRTPEEHMLCLLLFCSALLLHQQCNTIVLQQDCCAMCYDCHEFAAGCPESLLTMCSRRRSHKQQQ